MQLWVREENCSLAGVGPRRAQVPEIVSDRTSFLIVLFRQVNPSPASLPLFLSFCPLLLTFPPIAATPKFAYSVYFARFVFI